MRRFLSLPIFTRAGFILVFSSLLFSCSFFQEPTEPIKKELPKRGTLAVLGFIPALRPGQNAKAVIDPITGSVFMAEPIPSEQAHDLSVALYQLVLKQKRYRLIPLGRARGALMDLEITKPELQDTPLQFFKEVGQKVGADMVLAGYLYRWRERQGEAYGVTQAASVAFSVNLISVRDGRVLWAAKFDRTQHSLSENLLDVRMFFKGKGRWMTARELAVYGLETIWKKAPFNE